MPPKKKTVVEKKQGGAAEAAAPAVVRTAVVAPKKAVRFVAGEVNKSKDAVARPASKAPAGVVVPKQNAQRQKKGGKKPSASASKAPSGKRGRSKGDDDEGSDDSSDDEDDDASSSGSDDDLSDLADASSSDDDSDDGHNKKKKKNEISYSVLVLRYLPKEFQEPELQTFLNQFGAKVTNCFCVRSKRTHESKGIAYVQFDNEAVLPVVVDECNGMLLGGRTVRARIREMHRAMPTKQNIRIRRLKGARSQAHGPKLVQHNASKKSIVAQLVKYARAEKKNNMALKALGVDFASESFQGQFARLPKDLFLVKKARKEAAAVIKANAPVPPVKVSRRTPPPQPKKKQAKKAPQKPAKKAPVAAAASAPSKPAAVEPPTSVQPKSAAKPAPSKAKAPAPAPAKSKSTPAPAATSGKSKAPAPAAKGKAAPQGKKK